MTSNEKGISYVRRNLDMHQAETVPYQNDITFTLTTKQILNGLSEPIHINQVYDTDIYVEEVKEKMNDLKEKKEYLIIVGFNSHYHADGGKMLSLFRLNKNQTRTNTIRLRAYGENGDEGDYGSGFGDSEGKSEQMAMFVFTKKELQKSKRWTFQMSNMHLLNYSKKN